jgi:hypothetical protein
LHKHLKMFMPKFPTTRMKIKLMAAPSIVVMIIVLLIWYVYPALTDPIAKSGVIEKSAELKKDNENLEMIRGRSEKIHKLAADLNSSDMAQKKELLMDFLPYSIEEYKIIDNLNYLILKDELRGLAISVAQPMDSPALQSSAVSLSGEAGTQAVPEFKATSLTVSLSVQGSYEKIKSIFQKIYGLKRFNRVLAFKIEPANQGTAGTGDLIVTSSLEFFFLKESGSFSSVDDSNLVKNDFDRATLDRIAKSKETPLLPEIQLDLKGKPNPFIP